MGLFNLFGQGNGTKPKPEFKFSDDKKKAVITCSHVLDGEAPILLAMHDIDGDWQFLCGEEEHNAEDARVISLEQAVELDQTINDLFEMPTGVGAERKKIGAKWNPFRL